MILKLPEVFQQEDWSCGRTVFEIVTSYLGASGRKPQSSPIDGTDPRTLETAFRMCGLDVVSGNMDITQLRDHTRAGRPVACLVTDDSDLTPVGHWVACAGVAYRTIHIVCPIHGRVQQPLARFEERWKDEDRMGVKLVRWGIAVG